MLDRIRQMFGVNDTALSSQEAQVAKPNEAKPNEAQEDRQANGNVPLTQDEYAQAVMRRLQEDADAETKRFREEIEKLVSHTQSNAMPMPPTALPDAKESGAELPENPTVEDLLNFVNQMVEKKLEERIQQVLMQLPKVPASTVVDGLVAKHPTLQTVAEEAKQLFDGLPREYQNEQTADFILWWLKGKRSEAEKKEAISELLGVSSHSTQAGNVTLPYTSEQIREWAEAMGIDPKRLRQRLLETVQGGR